MTKRFLSWFLLLTTLFASVPMLCAQSTASESQAAASEPKPYYTYYVGDGLTFLWSGEDYEIGETEKTVTSLPNLLGGDLKIDKMMYGRQYFNLAARNSQGGAKFKSLSYKIVNGGVLVARDSNPILTDVIPYTTIDGTEVLTDMTLEVSQSYYDTVETAVGNSVSAPNRGYDGGMMWLGPFGAISHSKAIYKSIAVGTTLYYYGEYKNASDVATPFYFTASPKTESNAKYTYQDGEMVKITDADTLALIHTQANANALTVDGVAQSLTANAIDYAKHKAITGENTSGVFAYSGWPFYNLGYDKAGNTPFLNNTVGEAFTTFMSYDYAKASITTTFDFALGRDGVSYGTGASKQEYDATVDKSVGTYYTGAGGEYNGVNYVKNESFLGFVGEYDAGYAIDNGNFKNMLAAAIQDEGRNYAFTYGSNTGYLLHAIRVYDRVLTREEIAQNHFIDLAWRLGADLSAYDAVLLCEDSASILPFIHEIANNKDESNFTKEKFESSILKAIEKAENAENLSAGGLSFDNLSWEYKTEGYDEAPRTYAIRYLLPKDFSDSARAGVLFGNYDYTSKACIGIEIHTGGKLRFYHRDAAGVESNLYAPNSVDGRTDIWAQLTITVKNRTVTFYLNGLKVGTKELAGDYSEDAAKDIFCIGGDMRSNNTAYFQGKIKEIVLYEEALDGDTVAALYEDGVSAVTQSPIAHYDMTKASQDADIADLSGNGYNAKYKAIFFEDTTPVRDYAYSFAFIGDQQYLCDLYPEQTKAMYDWLIENKEEKKIEFVFGLGDITDRDTDTEWQTAIDAIGRLDGVIPYSLVRGNHDSKAPFINSFSTDVYRNQFDGFYQDSILNSYRTFTVGETDYLFVTLDYGANDDILAWASDIIEAYPDHRVIITTHAYLNSDGTTLDKTEDAAPSTSGGTNDGDDMWNKLVSQHANIVLVVSGHIVSEQIVYRQDKGVHGNTVTQMLIDPQWLDANRCATGLVALFRFSEDGREIDVEYYSTAQGKHFLKENQFSLTLIPDEPTDEPTNPYEEEMASAITFDGYQARLFGNSAIRARFSVNNALIASLEAKGLTVNYGTLLQSADASAPTLREVYGENADLLPLYVSAEANRFASVLEADTDSDTPYTAECVFGAYLTVTDSAGNAFTYVIACESTLFGETASVQEVCTYFFQNGYEYAPAIARGAGQ